MPEDVFMMKWLPLLSLLQGVAVSSSAPQIVVYQTINGLEAPASKSIQVIAGDSLTVTCILEGHDSYAYYRNLLIWGKRSKEFSFKDEEDLAYMAASTQKLYHFLYDENWSVHNFTAISKEFDDIKPSDRGLYFCGSLKHHIFKLVQIRVSEKWNFTECGNNKFQCEANGHCINLHYKCDGKADCFDSSDEFWTTCNGDPCEGKIRCDDGRCIPTTWCCNRYTDNNCFVTVRPSCCPPIPNPYDPLLYYNNLGGAPEVNKSSGPRYLFVTICVVSAILSFVLFIFIITKMCGIDTKPRITRIRHIEVPCFLPGTLPLQESDLLTVAVRNPEIDQPPPYSEVVDKPSLDDLINVAPPPYSSINAETDLSASNADNNRRQSAGCDRNEV